MKRNPADLTPRNNNARKKDIAKLKAELKQQAIVIRDLKRDVRSIVRFLSK